MFCYQRVQLSNTYFPCVEAVYNIVTAIVRSIRKQAYDFKVSLTGMKATWAFVRVLKRTLNLSNHQFIVVYS